MSVQTSKRMQVMHYRNWALSRQVFSSGLQPFFFVFPVLLPELLPENLNTLLCSDTLNPKIPPPRANFNP